MANVPHEPKEQEDAMRRIYDEWASAYDKETSEAGTVYLKPLAEYLDAAIKQVEDKPNSEIKIMDAGAGTGKIGVELKKLGYTNVQALDISQEMLNEAKKKNAYNKFICTPLSEQRIQEIETGEFDAVICAGTLIKAHVKSSALVEIIRMVKIGGLICFTLRYNEVADYQDMMLELENTRRWESISKKKVPHFTAGDMPKEAEAFLYKVLKH
ncbi:Methyltransferase domain [Desmophyllum pertusum]|uniref:Methyltransferase domain n=1 Tax=Desmophyllum pertusum TaxID=174260 RepID=A0A9X0CP20_9CNID|nr:Methyltransferase domain [Desmophyllum pertusum]